jgi:outer membrane protein OmpA-like peptidoglycan-associated protein
MKSNRGHNGGLLITEDIPMRKQLIIISAIASLAATPVFASSGVAESGSSREESIGVGAGAALGAIAGGPVGFMIGAMIGAKVGETLYLKDSEIDTLSGSLQSSEDVVDVLQNDVRELNGDVDTLSAELTRLEASAQPELRSLLQAGIAMDLLFRTDEHVLADTTGIRLAELAASLSSKPNIRVQLDGFADERGDAEYNYQLSEKRVKFVREQLIGSGVDASRISIAAHGEAPAQDASIDSYALERRVSLTLFIDETPSFAANP